MEPQVLEDMLKRVGGKFKLVSLYQKRMRELVRGLPPLAKDENNDIWEIAALEITGGKVELILGEEAEKLRKEAATREAEEVAMQEASKKPPAEKKKD